MNWFPTQTAKWAVSGPTKQSVNSHTNFGLILTDENVEPAQILMTTLTKSMPPAAMLPPPPPPGQVDEVIECTCTFEAGTEAFASVEEATCEQMVNTSTK